MQALIGWQHEMCPKYQKYLSDFEGEEDFQAVGTYLDQHQPGDMDGEDCNCNL